jgi:catechol 2,3-dioxygenase-like lactoylglutathione lyase family enzyme
MTDHQTPDRPEIRLGAIALDCADPAALAEFYRRLTGWSIAYSSEDFVALGTAPLAGNADELTALGNAALWLTIHRVPDHSPPTWPGAAVPKQIHLDFVAEDLDAAESFALGIGAEKAFEQPFPDQWRVLRDPAGHPFCLSANFPER